MITIHFDGSCSPNPGVMGVGAIIEDSGKILHTISYVCGMGTSNIAEFKALISALEYCLNNNYLDIIVYGDSNIVINTTFGRWTARHPNIKDLCIYARSLVGKFNYCELTWIPREENDVADRLSTQCFKMNCELVKVGGVV
jgi:ribonuclease HI